MRMTSSRITVRWVTKVGRWGNNRLIPHDPPAQHGSLPGVARVGQFKLDISKVEESDQCLVHSLAVNLWTDSNLLERVAEEVGSHTQLQ